MLKVMKTGHPYLTRLDPRERSKCVRDEYKQNMKEDEIIMCVCVEITQDIPWKHSGLFPMGPCW